MRAGTLDQRIELQELVQGFDDYGQPLSAWQTVLSSWAAVEPLQGREYLAAMQNQSETTIRVRLRYRPGVKSAMRVKHGTALYGIQSVIDVKSKGRELVLMCKASG